MFQEIMMKLVWWYQEFIQEFHSPKLVDSCRRSSKIQQYPSWDIKEPGSNMMLLEYVSMLFGNLMVSDGIPVFWHLSSFVHFM